MSQPPDVQARHIAANIVLQSWLAPNPYGGGSGPSHKLLTPEDAAAFIAVAAPIADWLASSVRVETAVSEGERSAQPVAVESGRAAEVGGDLTLGLGDQDDDGIGDGLAALAGIGEHVEDSVAGVTIGNVAEAGAAVMAAPAGLPL